MGKWEKKNGKWEDWKMGRKGKEEDMEKGKRKEENGEGMLLRAMAMTSMIVMEMIVVTMVLVATTIGMRLEVTMEVMVNGVETVLAKIVEMPVAMTVTMVICDQ